MLSCTWVELVLALALRQWGKLSVLLLMILIWSLMYLGSWPSLSLDGRLSELIRLSPMLLSGGGSVKLTPLLILVTRYSLDPLFLTLTV